MPRCKTPALMLYTGDVKKDPALSMCEPSTRGIWLDALCSMHDSGSGTLRGTARQLSRMCRCSESQMLEALRELGDTGAAIVSQEEEIWSLTNRRITRELEISDIRSEVGSKGGSKTQANREAKEQQNAEIENEIETVVEVDLDLKAEDGLAEAIYEQYPRKVAKKAAKKAIIAAIRAVAAGEAGQPLGKPEAAEWLLGKARAFAASYAGKQGEFTPHPATWFRAGRYLDEAAEWESAGRVEKTTQASVGVWDGKKMTEEEAAEQMARLGMPPEEIERLRAQIDSRRANA